MASPQKEDGYTAIANEIMDALCRIRIPGEEMQILNAILRKTYGWQKCEDAIALSQFVEMTGMNKPHIIQSVKGLLLKKVIAVTENSNSFAKVYKFNKNYDQWKPLPKKVIFKDGSRTRTIEDIKANIRKRDNNHCQICNHNDPMLPVHHIDYDQGNNDESNLITLCKTCHSRTNSNYDYWKELLLKKVMEILLPKTVKSITENSNASLPKTVPTKETNTKEKKTRTVFVIPDVKDVAAYCLERRNFVDPEKWHDFYSSNGWKVGRNPMKDWKAAVRTWEKSDLNGPSKQKATW